MRNRLIWPAALLLVVIAAIAAGQSTSRRPPRALPPAGAIDPIGTAVGAGQPDQSALWRPPRPGTSSTEPENRLDPESTIRAPVSRLPPLPQFERARRSRYAIPLARGAAGEEACGLTESDVNSGPALAAWLESLSPDTPCMRWLFHGNGPPDLRHAAFGNEENVIYVMRVAEEEASRYDGKDPHLAVLFFFFRGAYFTEYYDDVITFSTTVDQAMVRAIDAFISNPHFHDISDEHGRVLWEVFVCMDSVSHGYRARYLPVVKEWLAGFDTRHAEHYNLTAATNSLFRWLRRGHWDPEYLEAALSDAELVDILRDLAQSDELLDGQAAVVVENAAGELGSFLEYGTAPVRDAVIGGVRSVVDRYDFMGKGRYAWVRVVSWILYLDMCAEFDICGVEEEIEQSVLSIEHSCNQDINFRAQEMTPFQLKKACDKLGGVKIIFSQQLGFDLEPVDNDFNSTLEVVVFEDWDNYDLYSGIIFGNDTDNGGIYLEGDPSDPSNTARFIAHLADWLPDTPVWNLEHEYVHYLDGRFNLAGSFWDYGIYTHKTIWWIEGLAEYISHWMQREAVVGYARDSPAPLSELFGITYDDGDSVYPKGHLAMWYMQEQRQEDIHRFRSLLRAGEYDKYLNYLNGVIGNRLDYDWWVWISKRTGREVPPLDRGFTDDPIRPGATQVKAVHFTEIRARINRLRETSGLGAFIFTDPRPGGSTPIRLVHLLELREAIAAVAEETGWNLLPWTDLAPRAGVTQVKAIHLMELRAAVIELE